MQPFQTNFIAGILLILLMLLPGCLGPGTTKSTRFYELSSLLSHETKPSPLADLNQVTIGVGPVRIPKKLDRPQMVTRVAPNEIRLNEFNNWGGPLVAGISRVLAENLALLLDTEKIAIFPWLQATRTDFQVTVDVTDFIGTPGDAVQLRAWWSIFGENGRTELLKRYTDHDEPVTGQDIAAIVQAQSRALETLSRQIAESIGNLSQTRKPRTKK